MKKFSFKKLLSFILCFCLVITYVPLTAAAAQVKNGYYNRVADNGTLDLWKEYFPLEATQGKPLTTANAGGVWTDKSVFVEVPSSFPSTVKMLDDTKNFLTTLSTIAANKEVVGYSTVPTDTVFVLDLSNSMSSDDVDDLVDATNEAINRLQGINNNNRVGVVLYSGASNNRTYDNAVASLMPIDRYTTTNVDGEFIQYTGGTVRLARSGNRLQVSGTKATIESESKEHSGATYIQAGLWEAYKMFEAVPEDEIQIGDNNWQEDEYRMPIIVLMSDGAPTLGTSYFADVENSIYGTGNSNATKANVGDGNDTNITVGQGFLVQLTASYIKNHIENKYKVHTEKGTGRSLFYSLGFNLNSIQNTTARNIATSVLNPNSTTVTDSLWNTYNSLTSIRNTMEVEVEGRSGGNTDVVIEKNSYATSKNYVDEYFSASGTGLTDAFNDIVEEIILQSRYYPTHLEGGSPDFSGYIEFTDILGDYMEVKHINGILLGDVLFDGHMMASKLADTSAEGLGTPENPTALGDEFIRAVKTRLNIADTAAAQNLVAAAYEAQQLCYEEDRFGNVEKWSNYIGWYADASETFIKHWGEASGETVPANAVYKIKSYGFLGETTGSIKNSDMMYMSVQVKTDIATGRQTVSWKVPASLVPMITYLVTLTGTSIDHADDVNIDVEDKTVAPIRLIYETGLRFDLNEFNITRITGEEHVATDGHTRFFYNNFFDNLDAASHNEHITTLAEFTPNKENERFYYTFNSAVHKKVGEGYEIVPENEPLNVNGEYYHRRYIFTSASAEPVFFYERMSSASIQAAIDEGFHDDFESLEHQTVGAWVVPVGTPARELDEYDKDKTENLTGSAEKVFHPYVSDQNDIVYVDTNLGNNGLLRVTPATGIKISKTIDVFEDGTSDTFKFRIRASQSGNFDSWITALDETPSGDATTASLVNGVYEFEMKKDQTFWIAGLAAGTTYTVEEISDNDDYKIKSVHVNGRSTGTTALGTVTQYFIDDVDFVNTPVGEGNLTIEKLVVDQRMNTVNVSDSLEFTAEVTLTDTNGNPVSGTFDSSRGAITVNSAGKFTVKLTDGAAITVRGIPEETRYTVTEPAGTIPEGFELNANASTLGGVISVDNARATIVNTYAPVGTDGSDVQVQVTKEISGNRTTWQNGESYTFNLELIGTSGNTLVASKTISHADSEKKALFSLAGEDYDAAGTYVYRIAEVRGNQGGVSYDTAERRFTVTVADSDMDGDLEITRVSNTINTTVSGSWTVSANFNNVYAPTGSATATIDIQKAINDNHSLVGFQFALYDANPFDSAGADELIRSGVTGADGKASITLTYAANRATMQGAVYEYYLAEVEGDNPNITYTDKVYTVRVTVTDNGDGTIKAESKVYDGNNEVTGVVPFTNVYTPSSADYLTFSGTKVISTNNRVTNAGEFRFKLESQNGPLPANTTVSNAANGSFIFPSIMFDTAGEFDYVITEVDTGIGGFTYDTARYEITVKVTDSAAVLTAEIISFKKVTDSNETDAREIVFDNKYSATPATVAVNGTKLLTGKTMEANEFEFILSAATTGAPTPAYSTAQNDAKGKFTFGDITFTTAGTFVYNIVETEGSDSHYTYDKSVYTLTVTVTDNSEGTLSASYALTKNGADSSEIVFSNIYTPDPIVYDIYDEFGGTKVLDGRTLKEGEFEFRLINAITGQQIGETVKNDANGEFRFPKITINEVGTYHYKITEVIGDEKGITYDTNQFHVVLGVQQETNGRFTLVREELHVATIETEDVGGVPTEVTKYTDITGNGTVEFKNSYAADATKINISGNKMLSGRALKAEEFSFNLYNVEEDAASGSYVKGELVDTAKNTADGTFTFDALEIKTAGTYRFFVTEDATNPVANVTYDNTVYMVVVTVTDNFDGTLSAEYAYQTAAGTSETLTFLNTYTPPAPSEVPKTGDDSNVWMWIALAFVSTLGIFATKFFRPVEEKEEK
ncbi:MAG: hypothetical protein IJX79_01085 [Clostridia bacterium]|nr:hypothetical protein [Clostridia bacterium]